MGILKSILLLEDDNILVGLGDVLSVKYSPE